MKKIIIFIVFFVKINLYANLNYNVDLTKVNDNVLQVELTVNDINKDTVTFQFPSVVSGTYSILDYGRFIKNLQAYDIHGSVLPVKKSGLNSYVLYNSKSLNKIIYNVEDTWGSKVKKNKIFAPAGSSFEKNKVFVINNAALFGYFKEYLEFPIDLYFTVPENIDGFTSLKPSGKKGSYKSPDYRTLVDSPIMFCEADTASFRIAGSKINICAYHENGEKIAVEIKDEVQQCMHAILNFCGFMPVDEYTFIIYVSDFTDKYKEIIESPRVLKIMKNFGDLQAGALEHKHSSMYTLVDLGENIVSPMFKEIDYRVFLKEVIIHEFMHTITPIGLHSYEIGNIDYNNPEMSKHLWLYEGITEYFANLIMLQNGMIDMEEFFNVKTHNNILYSLKYPYAKMSMADMSENVLEKKYNKQYRNVYTYAANLGLLLDMYIIERSNGQTSLKDIVLGLHKKYGYNKSFEDDGFIDEFLTRAPDSIDLFFENYILGNKKPDFNNYINKFGITYYSRDSVKSFTIRNQKNNIVDFRVPFMAFRINGTMKVKITKPGSIYMIGDEINFYEIQDKVIHGKRLLVENNDTVLIHVKRKKQVIEMPFIITVKNVLSDNYFVINNQPAGPQIFLRNKWMGIKNEN